MHLEYYLQIIWPELNVNVVSTTEQWAGAALAGLSLGMFFQNFSKFDVSNGLPFMGYTEAELSGVPAEFLEFLFQVS